MSQEAFSSWQQRVVTLLQRLKSLEDNGEDLVTVRTSHLEVYDILLLMAPKFEHLNPRLGDLLRRRRDEVQQQNQAVTGARRERRIG